MKPLLLAVALCFAVPASAQTDTQTNQPPQPEPQAASAPEGDEPAPPWGDRRARNEEEAAELEACTLCGFFSYLGLEELDRAWADLEVRIRGREGREEVERALADFRTRREALSVRYGALENPTPEDQAAAQRDYDELRADLLRTRYSAADRAGYDRLVLEEFSSYDRTIADLRARFESASVDERGGLALQLIRLRRQRDALGDQHRALRLAARRSDPNYQALRQAFTDDLVSYDQVVRGTTASTTSPGPSRTAGPSGAPN